MDAKKIFERFSEEGFIKQTHSTPVNSQQKAQLNRKGNILFNEGKIEAARRVFITTGYSDGLIRVGDWYRKQGREIEALKMYWIAPERKKAEEIILRVAAYVQNLMQEDAKDE